MVLVQNLGVQNSLRSTWPGSKSVEKDLGAPMGIKLNMNKQCGAAVAKKGNRMLGCINNDITSRDKKAIFLLLLRRSTPHMHVCFQVWSPPSRHMLVGWRRFTEGSQR